MLELIGSVAVQCVELELADVAGKEGSRLISVVTAAVDASGVVWDVADAPSERIV